MMNGNIFATCQEAHPNGEASLLMECVSKALQASDKAHEENLTNFLFVLSGGLIFFMQAGFAALCAGAVRIKNVQNTMLKNLLDPCGAAIAFFLIGKRLQIRAEARSRSFSILSKALMRPNIRPEFVLKYCPFLSHS